MQVKGKEILVWNYVLPGDSKRQLVFLKLFTLNLALKIGMVASKISLYFTLDFKQCWQEIII